MRSLQPGFDQLAILERQRPRYRHDFLDDTVKAEVTDFRLSRPKITAPCHKVVSEIRQQPERFLRLEWLLAPLGEEQTSFLRFDFIFHARTFIVEMTDLKQIQIQQRTD